MAIYKCKMCGGTLEVQPGESVAICDSCGSKQTLPNLSDERRANMFDRANHFRRNGDFDKAEGIFESILAEDREDAESYWSLVLCKYGISYVEDPKTHKQIPTVNRAQYTPVKNDENYLSAIKYADGYQHDIYEAEAKQIDKIQKGILEISRKEEPFDVFISYKDTDDLGQRTQDSALAQDIYTALTKEGYKVFFSRITLENKLGSEYEPYIFAALNSAKVMLLVGTSKESLNAVWVKNEWSRFLQLVKKDSSKVLIPVYANMSPYDMPDELSNLMAQDMSKIGFIQDLTRGIEKIVKKEEKKAAKEAVIVNSGTDEISPLLKRAFMFLEDGDWNSANEYCEKVLDKDPENARAYLGKLMAELRMKTQEDLKDCEKPFDDRNNYLKVVRFGDKTLKDQLSEYIEVINERNENASKDLVYASAKSKMTGQSISNYEDAIRTFQTIPGWRDADKQIDICLGEIEKIKVKEEADRLELERKAEERRIADEQQKKIISIAVPVVIACIIFFIVHTKVILPNNIYNSALQMYNEGKYEKAITAFTALDGYKDSAEQIEKIKSSNQYIETCDIGDTLYFGSYEQDNNTSNGKENIEWLVLSKEDNKILIISEKALDSQQYNSSDTNVTWETCSLRKWMNDTFLDNTFSEDEQEQIQSTVVSADKNPQYDTNQGNDTTDKVFLLSIEEAKKYFSSNEDRKCVPTAYAIAQGAWTLDDYTKNGVATCEWWLRTTGKRQFCATYVCHDSSIEYRGGLSTTDYVCVRPALWINLDN